MTSFQLALTNKSSPNYVIAASQMELKTSKMLESHILPLIYSLILYSFFSYSLY